MGCAKPQESQAFHLVDDDCNRLASLRYDPNTRRPELVFYGPDALRLSLTFHEGKPELGLMGKSGRVLASLFVHEKSEKAGLVIRDQEGNKRIYLGTDDNGNPVFEMFNRDEKVIWDHKPEQSPQPKR